MQQERLISLSHRLITHALNCSAHGKVDDANTIMRDLRDLLIEQPCLEADGSAQATKLKTFEVVENNRSVSSR